MILVFLADEPCDDGVVILDAAIKKTMASRYDVKKDMTRVLEEVLRVC
jgi:hypothetical protein